MKKILPIKEPPITHSPNDTYMFSMLMTIPEAYPWIMNNFINIYMMENTWEDMFFNWEHRFECPFMEISRMDGFMLRTILGKEKSFFETVVELLQSGYYIYSCINMKYIPAYFCEKDLSHNIFIYGCDTDNEIFYIADFFNIHNRKFAFQTCTFKELENSFQHYYDTIEEDNSSIYDDVITYTPRITVQWKFNASILKNQLQAYVEGEKLFAGTSIKNQFSYVFGIRIYDRLIQLMEEKEQCDVRPFQLLYDRARIMDMRITYLQQIGVLSQNDFLSLKKMNDRYLDHALATRNCFIKETYKYVHYSSDFSWTINSLKSLKEEDYEFTTCLINSF